MPGMYRARAWLPVLCLLACTSVAEPRRIRVTPLSQEQEEESSVQYYTAAEPDSDEQVILVSTEDHYNGLYGQPTASSRSAQDNFIPGLRSSSQKGQKGKEQSKSPPVQTIRNYNKVNDDGSFTFGYEAADGSFKEETRGTDCVVRGKYGYVDPDGNKREFTYVSGNPCDPNAPKEESLEEESVERESSEADDATPNYPTRPIRPIRPTATPRPVTVYQNNFVQEEEEPEPEQVLRQQPVQTIRPRPHIRQQYSEDEQSRPNYPTVSTTPASVLYKQQTIRPVNITPRPVTPTPRTEPATTYRPQLLQVAVTPRPAPLYTKQFVPSRTLVSSTAAPVLRGSNSIDFESEFQKFHQQNSVVSSTQRPIVNATPRIISPVTPTAAPNQGQIYSSALVYDPSSGQYNTQLYQTLPQTEGQISVNQRIQPYVHQPQTRPAYTIQQASLYRQASSANPLNNQAVYQQQQAELQFQNSAQLYAQQQQQRLRSQQQQQQLQQQPQQNSPQPFYYVQPALQRAAPALTGGQIDAFLRGHNIHF